MFTIFLQQIFYNIDNYLLLHENPIHKRNCIILYIGPKFKTATKKYLVEKQKAMKLRIHVKQKVLYSEVS